MANVQNGGIHSTNVSTLNLNHNFTITQPKCSLYKESLSYSGPVIWNAIPTDIKKSSTINAFVNKLCDWMLNSNSA